MVPRSRKEKYMDKCYSGEWAGTMCLTEPGAGSDVGALKTTAKTLPDGEYQIQGTKCFHLRRRPRPDTGTSSTRSWPASRAIRPAPRGFRCSSSRRSRVNEDGSLGRSERRQDRRHRAQDGHQGLAHGVLNFGEDGKCVGELLGEERDGMKIMFQMMNEARLGIGMQGLDTGPRRP